MFSNFILCSLNFTLKEIFCFQVPKYDIQKGHIVLFRYVKCIIKNFHIIRAIYFYSRVYNKNQPAI